MKKYLPLVILFFGLPLAYADNSLYATAYQVDIVVFRYANLGNINPDLWRTFVPRDTRNAIQLQPNNNTQSYYQALPAQRFLLNKEAYNLKNNPNFRVLSQISWIQPADNNKEILIKTNELSAGSRQPFEVNGTIKITPSAYEYLNLTTNLQLTEINSSGSMQSINLNEFRRIFPNQLNYLDTPAFGILIKVKAIA